MDLDSVVKPEMTQEWEEAKKEWFPRIDSKSNAAYDLRTPGNRAIQLTTIKSYIYITQVDKYCINKWHRL